MLNKKMVSLCRQSETIQIYHTEQGKFICDGHCLYPLGKYDAGEILIYERYFPNGNKYFVIKIGMELKGIVLPYAIHVESFRKNISYIFDLCKMTKEKPEEKINEQKA